MVFIVQWPSLAGSVSVTRESAESALVEAESLIEAGVPHVRVHVPDGRVLKPGDFHLLKERWASDPSTRPKAPRGTK